MEEAKIISKPTNDLFRTKLDNISTECVNCGKSFIKDDTADTNQKCSKCRSKSIPYDNYVECLIKLADIRSKDNEGTKEEDDLLDEMDVIWEQLTSEEKNELQIKKNENEVFDCDKRN